MEQKEIESRFANEKNMYYAHGIGAYSEDVVNSIFKNGLRCSHNELYWTVVEFGEGSESLFREKEEMMSNWEHKGSKHIIIVSLPEIFHLLDVKGTALFQKRHAAFLNSISEEQADELGIAKGLYLKPEFVMGMYDTIKKDFILNDRYYENLPEEEQKRVLDDVRKQYIDTIEHSDWTLAEYAQILQDVGVKCPLTPEEIENSSKDKIEKQELDMVTLPNGIEIPRKQYEEEYTIKEQRTDMVTLSNGIKIPKKQYEEEQGTKKQGKRISIGNIKTSVSQAKVTAQETNKVTQDIKNMKEIKRLQLMQKTGQTLTQEQRLFLKEHIRQTQQAQILFQQRQENKKSKENGIEM